MQLTQHFTLEELVHSDVATARKIDNTPPADVVQRLTRVAEMLERVRSTLGCTVNVSSGYRCPDLNKAVGGVPESDHVQGMAADIQAPMFGSPTKIAQTLAPLVSTLGIGQIILEGVKGKQWVHLSTRTPDKPINRIITITDAGVKPGIVGLA
jgi:zinc D-Ala-D-Ala carboxypeptidase